MGGGRKKLWHILPETVNFARQARFLFFAAIFILVFFCNHIQIVVFLKKKKKI